MRRPKLTDDQIAEHLPRLPDWARAGEALTKTYAFAGFTQAMQFVNQMAEYAGAVNHHPDLDIRYSKVTVTLSTHDSGGITQADVDSAAAADGFADVIISKSP